MRMTKTILGLACCWTVPAMATDAPDFTTLYNLYKNLATQNDITVTADITSTRLLNTPGAQATVINGGGFNFDGAGYLGFVISNGYNFSLTRGGEFTMDGTTANITNSLTGFSNSSYGGVISNLDGNTVIDNSAFTNNVSASGGGAIYQGANSVANIGDSVFQSNQATRGDGGVIYSEYESTMTITNSVFIDNSARDYGGVAFNDGALNINNTTFISNTADSGGALYNSNTMNITSTEFSNNTATSGAGAIYTTGAMNVTDTVFKNNSGATGGAIGNYGITGDTLYAVVQNSVFSDNSAEYGGAIYNWDDMYVIDSNFTNNSATESGGAIHNLAELYLIAMNDDITFTGNTLNNTPNAIYSDGTIGMNAAPGRTITFNDPIQGTGNININQPYVFDSDDVPTGGDVVLSADMSGFSGNVTQYAGTVHVNDGATFFNAQNLDIQGGTLVLGTNNIHATNVSFGDESRLQISVQDQNQYGYILADTFTISDTANLDVILYPSAIPNGGDIKLHLLRSDNAVTDNFIPQINNTMYEFMQVGNGWYALTQVAEFDDVIRNSGGTQNNLNTAGAWQNAPDATQTTGHALYNRLIALLQTNPTEYIHALSALAPSAAPLMQIMGTSYLSRTQSMINNTRNEYDVGRGKIWTAIMGTLGHLDRTDQHAKFNIRGIGGGIGAESGRNDITVGGAFTFQYDKSISWAHNIRATTDGGALYAKYTPNNLEFQAGGAMFYTHMREVKNVAGLALDNNPSMYTYGAWSDIGYKFQSENWRITPRIGTKYTMIHHSTSTDDATQTIRGDNMHFWTAYTDATVGYDAITLGDVQLIPSVTIGGTYDMRADTQIFDVAVNNTTYTITGTPLARWAGTIGADMRIKFDTGAQIDISLATQLRQGYSDITATVYGILRF